MARNSGQAVFIILPGVSASIEGIQALRDNARGLWPEARVEVPAYVSRWRGVREVGRWLERWAAANMPEGDDFYVLGFILGAAALPHAPVLLSRVRRLVVLRSRYQEAVPRYLRRRFPGPLAALLFGRAVADLGQPPFWPPAFVPPCPTLTVVETRPTRLAERLQVQPLNDRELGIISPVELNIDHDFAYFAPTLMKRSVEWLRSS